MSLRIEALSHLSSPPLDVQLRRFRWLVPAFVVVFAAVHQFGERWLVQYLPTGWEDWSEIVVYGVTGSIVAWFGLTWLATAVARRAKAEEAMQIAYAELEANHQKLLALHDLGGDVSAASDEEAVLELAAQAPLKLAGASASTVVTFDDNDDRLNLDMAWGLSDNYLGALRQRMNNGIPAARCRTCVPLRTKAASDCPLFIGLEEHARSDGIGSLICLPISHERERVGVISAYFSSPDGPSEDQVRLLNILGGTIAGALYTLRSRTRQVNTLHEIDRATHTTQALNDLASKLLDVTITGWQAQAGALFLREEQIDTWTCHAQRNMGSTLTAPRYNRAWQVVDQAYETEMPVRCENFDAELYSAVAVPLASEGKPFGAIFLGARSKRAFSSEHAELLMTMAHQIALAIRNAQLYLQVEQMAVLEERYRLSREIHDGLAQTLAYLGLQVERLDGLLTAGRYDAAQIELGEIHQTLRAAYVDAREAIDGLRLSMDASQQLNANLGEYCSEFARQSGLHVSFNAEPTGVTANPTVSIQLLRIAQEALTNVRKHAQAKNVQVRLAQSATQIELSITDDGCGFASAHSGNRIYKSHGLSSMRERATSLGGKLTVATGPEQGTRLVVSVPNSGV